LTKGRQKKQSLSEAGPSSDKGECGRTRICQKQGYLLTIGKQKKQSLSEAGLPSDKGKAEKPESVRSRVTF